MATNAQDPNFNACLTNLSNRVQSVSCHGQITQWKPGEKKIITSRRLAAYIAGHPDYKDVLRSDAPVREEVITRTVETSVFRPNEAQLKVLENFGVGQLTAVLLFLSGGEEPVKGAKLPLEDLKQKVRNVCGISGQTLSMPLPPAPAPEQQ